MLHRWGCEGHRTGKGACGHGERWLPKAVLGSLWWRWREGCDQARRQWGEEDALQVHVLQQLNAALHMSGADRASPAHTKASAVGNEGLGHGHPPALPPLRLHPSQPSRARGDVQSALPGLGEHARPPLPPSTRSCACT